MAVAEDAASRVDIERRGQFERIEIAERGASINHDLSGPGPLDAVEERGLQSELGEEFVIRESGAGGCRRS